jgi:flavin reductase (DIM6/NTAB) family NADH-FMN oxidoreductase RutF
MELDPATLAQRDLYKLMIGCIVPRPIAWVSSQSSNGINNLAPFSFFNGIGANPPAVSIAITHTDDRPTGRKDTLSNILDLGEFVVNVVNESVAVAMNETATNYPADVDEFAAAGLTPTPSQTVHPPRVAESPVSFECSLHTTVQVGEGPGSATLVVGIIKHIHINDAVITERGHIDVHKFQPIGRLAGNSYCYVHEVFELVRKSL